MIHLDQMRFRSTTLQIFIQSQHLVSTHRQKFSYVIPAHVVCKVLPRLHCSLMPGLHCLQLWMILMISLLEAAGSSFMTWQQSKLKTASSGAWSQEISESKREVFKVDSSISIMIKISEDYVTVSLQ